mgnify:CR=1 FL=1
MLRKATRWQKERTRKPRTRFEWVLFMMAGFVAGGWFHLAHAQQYHKSVYPYEVIVYEHKDYTGAFQSFTLDPNKRLKIVPFLDKSMDNRISSFQCGEKVGVMVFNHPKFIHFTPNVPGFEYSHVGRQYSESVPDLSSPNFRIDDDISSLIVYHRDLGPTGVALANKPISQLSDQNNRFYFLPEDWSEPSLCFKTLEDLDGESEFLVLFPEKKDSFAYGKVHVTLFEKPNCQGKWLTLPGAGGYSTRFELNRYDWDEKAHSLEVRWEGPIPPVFVQGKISGVAKVPESQVHVRAPSAPTEARAPSAPDLEKGFDRPGSDYRNFPFDAGPERCQQACAEDPNCKAFTWVRPGVQGPQARCWLKSAVPTAVANANCVSGVKVTPSATQPAASAPPAPSSESAIEIGGIWKSSVGLVYEIRQRGEHFGWTVANSDEQGRGTCQGKDLMVTWSSALGKGSAKGKITQIDSAGKAIRIEWDNGAVFFR